MDRIRNPVHPVTLFTDCLVELGGLTSVGFFKEKDRVSKLRFNFATCHQSHLSSSIGRRISR